MLDVTLTESGHTSTVTSSRGAPVSVSNGQQEDDAGRTFGPQLVRLVGLKMRRSFMVKSEDEVRTSAQSVNDQASELAAR